MSTELIINATLPETRIALLENNEIQELHIERDSERGIVGNIYKGKVIRVLPGMQAAFVDIGLEKAAFLYVDDIFFPDMKNPLLTHPLPEPKQPIGTSSPTAAPPKPIVTTGRPVGRGGRAPRGEVRPAKGTPQPGTPEAHALAQREYARLMLAGGTEKEHEEPVPAPIASEANPSDFQNDESQPEARAPMLPPSLEEDEEDEADPSGVYRAEPIIDADAWAEDLEEADETAPAVAPAPGTETETAQQATEVLPVAPAPVVVAPPPQAEEEDDEDEDIAEMPRRKKRREHVNIADIIKEGQDILVQVAKDPIGTKGARLTCHVSLPGRYLVFMPTVDHIGVSRRIESEAERRRLKETISKIRPAKTGVIVRTASGKQTDKKLKADLDYLVATWNDIQKKYNRQRTPSVAYQDMTIVLRAIRDMFTDEVDKVVVDSKREHKAIMKFVTRFIPHVKDKVELYTGDMPIFDAFGIETEISRAMERKVWLKSGGYLVVDQAEALVAIDVNTGRYVGKKTLEETILKTNLEAVKEIAYQLRIRNCGGIIILDLIDMEKEANRDKVYKALEEALRKDRARPTIMKISQLGLIEMTRKRTRDSLVRSLCEPCSYCEGRGFVKNRLTISYDIMRDLEREGMEKETQAISVQCHPSVADVLLEDKRDVLENLEHQFSKKITIRGNGAYHVEQYELIAQRDAKNMVWSSEERKQIVRQRVQARANQLQAETRKQQEVERKVDNERRRAQKEAEEQRRREKRAALEERKKLAEERRAKALADGVELPPEEIIEDDLDLAEEEGAEVSGESGPRQPGSGDQGGDRSPRRRRGRRGRGRGRGRGPGAGPAGGPPGPGREGGRAGGGGSRPQQGVRVGPPNVQPNTGNPTFAPPGGGQEHYSETELAGSVEGAGGGEGEAQPGGQPGQPGQPPRAPGRRRRRGRRGGRNRRFRGAGPREGGGVGTAAEGGAPMVASSSSDSSGGGGNGGDGGGGGNGGPEGGDHDRQ